MKNIGVFDSLNGNKYIYDGVTNIIVPGNKELIEVIQNNKEKDRNKIFESANPEIRVLMQRWNLFGEPMDMKIDIDFVKQQMREYPYSQLILSLTEDCNLRCKYCIFSGQYEGMRTHSLKEMSLEVALSCVDYFLNMQRDYSKYAPNKNQVISFYGGEPLLKFDIIREVVSYAHSRGYKGLFALTTNGTLLNEDRIEYMVTNNFALSISLDGAKELHDKNRVFKNDIGTHDVVFSNVKKYINEIDKQGKTDKLPCTILTCYNTEVDLQVLNNFFIENKEIFNRCFIRANEIKPINNLYGTEKIHESMKLLAQDYFNSLIEGKTDRDKYFFMENLFGVSYKMFYARNLAPHAINYAGKLGGGCIPGSKIFVDTDGQFHACERVNQYFPIGNYKEGINFEKVMHLMDVWMEAVEEHCSDCPYKSICSGNCLANCATNDKIDIKPFCKGRRATLERILGQLYTILEKNPQSSLFFTYTKDKQNKKYKNLQMGCD